MVHGRDVSIGCLAMTDSGIEEIYTMVEQALVHGQKNVPVQIYPFVPTPARLSEEKDSPHAAFWTDMDRTPLNVGLDGTDLYSGPGEGRPWQAGRCGAIKILRLRTGG